MHRISFQLYIKWSFIFNRENTYFSVKMQIIAVYKVKKSESSSFPWLHSTPIIQRFPIEIVWYIKQIFQSECHDCFFFFLSLRKEAQTRKDVDSTEACELVFINRLNSQCPSVDQQRKALPSEVTNYTWNLLSNLGQNSETASWMISETHCDNNLEKF